MSWGAPFISNMPSDVGAGSEPAITNANHILQTMLGPPFVWPWNRAVAPLSVLVNTQDTVLALSDFGFLEMASLDGATDASGGKLTIAEDLASANLADAGQKQRPSRIQLFLDDNAGNYTFRTQPVADGAYSGKIIYQKKPVLFTSVAGSWSPIPDEMQYIYDSGWLALSMVFEQDQMFAFFNQKFISGLLGRAQGLSEMQRNIFLANWLDATRQAQVADLANRQGRTAMGV